MKYKLMLIIAFILAVLSSILTAWGLMELFALASTFILILFIVIDLGRFLLFNFLVDEWQNLRKIKYFIAFVLSLLFIYSGVGIYSKLDSLVSSETKKAMIEIASINQANENTVSLNMRTTNLANLAEKDYNEAISWNKLDYQNCLARAKSAKNILEAENKCNNMKRRLDKNALKALNEAMSKVETTSKAVEDSLLIQSENKSEIAATLQTICKLSGKKCNNYDDLQLALSLIIFLVIIGTDYIQICIVLSINTRKNKNALEKYIQAKNSNKMLFMAKIKALLMKKSLKKRHTKSFDFF